MKPWLLSLLTCLECGGELSSPDALETEGDSVITGTLECAECELLWPVLAGIPFLLPDPGAYLSSHRDTILAALAEQQLASVASLSLIDDFSTGYISDAYPIKDDWTQGEASRSEDELPQSPGLESLRELLKLHQRNGPQAALTEMIAGMELSLVFEIGPGAGLLSQELAKHCEQLVLIDNSLRSLLRARRIAGGQACKVAAVVADAGQLELAADSASAVIAANVVDLLDKPDDFLSAASRWLVRGGELIVSTPDPSLGGDQDDMLKDMLEALEYEIVTVLDWVPWLRVHGARYSQLYWTQIIRASV